MLVESKSHMPFLLPKPFHWYFGKARPRYVRINPVGGEHFDIAFKTNMSSVSDSVSRDALYMMTGGNGKNLGRLINGRGCFA
jgi:hypothetical protein